MNWLSGKSAGMGGISKESIVGLLVRKTVKIIPPFLIVLWFCYYIIKSGEVSMFTKTLHFEGRCGRIEQNQYSCYGEYRHRKRGD